MSEQNELEWPLEMLPESMIQAQPSATAGILLGAQIAGFQDKEAAHAAGLDNATWSKLKSGQAYFPQDRLTRYMRKLGNAAPLQVLAWQAGYDLVPHETEMQRRLRIEKEARERVEAENRLLRSMLTGRTP